MEPGTGMGSDMREQAGTIQAQEAMLAQDVMQTQDGPADDIIVHGGSLLQAAALFPDAPGPWIDLSTGINPHPYTRRPAPSALLTRLPEPGRHAHLCAVAGRAWNVQPGADVVAAPGTQMLLSLVMMLVPPGRAMVLSPTYSGHASAAEVAGHAVATPGDIAMLADADVAVVVNPNNPDGRVHARADLLDLARHMRRKGGLLVVDEAFIDASPQADSVADAVTEGGLIVLRSFGKFYGLAGVRLGFAVAGARHAARLNAILGPWAVSGPALEYGVAALQDAPWQAAMRKRLAAEADRLDARLAAAGLVASGGVSLFRLVRTARAAQLFATLGRHGLWVRRFEARSGVGTDAIRIGLPPDKAAMNRLATALEAFAQGG